MIVAVTKSDEWSNTNGEKIVGFLEVGWLPSPVPIRAINESVSSKKLIQVPYLGNLAVDNQFRRNKIATKLVFVTQNLVRKWNISSNDELEYDIQSDFESSLFVAVESENIAALKFYERIGFDLVYDDITEIENIYLEQKRSISDLISAIEKLNSEENLYYSKKKKDVGKRVFLKLSLHRDIKL